MSNPTKIYNDYVRANLPNTMTFNSSTARYNINNHSFFSFNRANWYFKYITKFGYASLSAYAVNNFDPDLVFDFKQNYYRTGGTETTLSSAVTHARAGNATMVDSDGLLKWAPHNILIRSEELNRWTQSGTGSVVVDNAVAPDGTTTAATLTISSVNLHRYIRSSATYTAGDKITFSFWVRSDTVTTLPFGINGGTNGANNYIFSDVAVTSTWQLVEFEFTVLGSDTSLYYIIGKQSTNPVNNQLGDIEIWHPHAYRSDLGGMVNNSATGNSYVPTTSSAVYAPRVGHHVYNGSAWVNEGVLHESEARTNLMTNSGDLTNGWAGNAIIGTPTAGSPFGTYQTFSPVGSGVNLGGAQRYQIGKPLTLGSTYVGWALVKYSAGSGWFDINMYDTGDTTKRVYFDVQNGAVGTKDAAVIDYGMVDYGDGWWLCWASANAASTSGGLSLEVPNGDGVQTCTATDVILIAGTQYELGSTPSSYIPTSGSTVTRAAETLTVPAANLPYPTPVVIGSELVTNGTFDTDSDWTLDAASSITDGKLVTTKINAGTIATQSVSFVAGKVYLVTFDFTNPNNRVLVPRLSGGTLSSLPIIGNGTGSYSNYITAKSGNNTFQWNSAGTGFQGTIDNVSIKEINPLALSIQMDGKITYADNGDTAFFYRWLLTPTNYAQTVLQTTGSYEGRIRSSQRETNSGYDEVATSSSYFTPDINVPFNISSRHGSTFLNGAEGGTALTADTTPTALPDLSSSDLLLGSIFMGTIAQFRVWDEDLTDAGIVEATEPSTEPSLQLTFDGSSTNSFTVLDWSE